MAFDWRTDWKRPILWGASFGISVVLALFILYLGIQWYTSRPKAWNANAIKGISSTIGETFDVDDSDKVTVWDEKGKPIRHAQELKGSGFQATFIIENQTATDITLPQDLRFYERGVKSQALSEIGFSLIHPFVIPAHERAEVTANMSYSCGVTDMDTGTTKERDGKECFQDVLGDVSEFVAFDNTSHIRLNLPKPVFYAGKESSPPDSTGDKAAPDSGKPWDEFWACDEAKRLEPICKQKKIALEAEQAYSAGWIPVGKLPTLPRPPKGYLLEPDLETCKVIYQWDFYCRTNGPKK